MGLPKIERDADASRQQEGLNDLKLSVRLTHQGWCRRLKASTFIVTKDYRGKSEPTVRLFF